MKRRPSQGEAAAALCRRAGAGLAAQPLLTPPPGVRTGHTQVGLETQNERLRPTQADLDASRARYLDLYEQAPVGYLTLSEKGLILKANLTVADLLGVARAALLRKPLPRFIFPADQDTLVRHRRTLSMTGAPQRCEVRLVRADGTAVWVQVNATAVPAPGGAPEYRVAITDISERTQADQAMAAKVRQLDTIFSLVPTGIAVLDRERRTVAMNQALSSIVQLTPAELAAGGYLGRTYIRPDGTPMPVNEFASVRASRERRPVHEVETGVVTGDGQVRWTLVSAAPLDLAEGTTVVVTQDITARKQAETALRESESRYRSLFSVSLDAAMLTAPDGRILAANAAACRLFRRSEEDMIQVGRAGVMDASDPRVPMALQERDQTGRFVGELTFRRGDGTTFLGEISSAVFRDREGEERTSMVVRDISARKQAEEGLRASRAQLQILASRIQAAREEERAALARELHDGLAQDLTRLKIDLLLLRARLGKPVHRAVRAELASGVGEMAEIADRAIKSVQRIATGLRPAVLDSLGLCAAVEWQARDFQSHAGIPCVADVPADELPVDPDVATAAFRILQEALTNVQRHAHATRVEIVLRQEAGQLCLRIADNGSGISAAALGSPISIGLAGMRERALLLGGSCEIRGQPSLGTRVDVRLPLARRNTPPGTTP